MSTGPTSLLSSASGAAATAGVEAQPLESYPETIPSLPTSAPEPPAIPAFDFLHLQKRGHYFVDAEGVIVKGDAPEYDAFIGELAFPCNSTSLGGGVNEVATTELPYFEIKTVAQADEFRREAGISEKWMFHVDSNAAPIPRYCIVYKTLASNQSHLEACERLSWCKGEDFKKSMSNLLPAKELTYFEKLTDSSSVGGGFWVWCVATLIGIIINSGFKHGTAHSLIDWAGVGVGWVIKTIIETMGGGKGGSSGSTPDPWNTPTPDNKLKTGTRHRVMLDVEAAAAAGLASGLYMYPTLEILPVYSEVNVATAVPTVTATAAVATTAVAAASQSSFKLPRIPTGVLVGVGGLALIGIAALTAPAWAPAAAVATGVALFVSTDKKEEIPEA